MTTINEGSGYRCDTLTPMQTKVIRYIARGYSDVEIAEAVQVSVATVFKHVANIHKRLRLYRRSQLAIYALKSGLISLDNIELPGYCEEKQ